MERRFSEHFLEQTGIGLVIFTEDKEIAWFDKLSRVIGKLPQ